MRNGAVAIAGDRIVGVGEFHSLRGIHPQAGVTDLGDVILLPGLINAHTHLELTHFARDDAPEGSFADWILSIPRRRGTLRVEDAVKDGIAQCLKFGVTCVGDITQQSEPTRRTLADSPLRAVSYGEALGLGAIRDKFDLLMSQNATSPHASDRLRIGISPHAPYTVDLPGYEQILQLAKARNLPLATHLAEDVGETSFLTDQAGPFRELWNKIGSWADGVQTFRGSPIEMAHAIGLLEYPSLLAHVNFCTDSEMSLLAKGHASVVYCPRTHQYFGRPPHRWQEMLERGINVAVGTDSLASNPDLNPVEELRLLRTIAPNMPGSSLWQLVTLRAAKAIQWDQDLGSLTAGKLADIVAFEAKSNDPLEELLQGEGLPVAVWIGGSEVRQK